jgi:hypothetical protein
VADKAVLNKVLEKSKINPPLGFPQHSLAFVASRLLQQKEVSNAK